MRLLLAAAALAAGASGASDLHEDQFLALLNAERVAAGRAALQPEPAMNELARAWAEAQASSQRLAHRPHHSQVEWIESQVTRRWERVGENVGYGASVGAVHRALMQSPMHRANALGDFTHVGVGAARDAAGRIWVTFNFLKATGPSTRAELSAVPRAPDAAAGRAIATVAQSGPPPP